MNYYNLPNKINALLKSASISRKKLVWFNLPYELRLLVKQLNLINEDLENEELQVVLDSIKTIYWFNLVSSANKIETAINIINK